MQKTFIPNVLKLNKLSHCTRLLCIDKNEFFVFLLLKNNNKEARPSSILIMILT